MFNLSIQISGLNKTSLLDYPKKISSIIFTQGCNFKCGYCHNPHLNCCIEKSIYDYDVQDFFEFLKKRKGKIDAVVISGGEPCLQIDLIPFIKEIKKIGYFVKLDTNGTYPNKIKYLLENNLIDYIAMDIKAPLEKYSNITNTNVDTEKISKSIFLIKNSNINYEFRITILKKQLHYEDFDKIGKLLNEAKTYYLQKFVSSNILDNNLQNEKTYSDKEFAVIINIVNKYVQNVFLR